MVVRFFMLVVAGALAGCIGDIGDSSSPREIPGVPPEPPPPPPPPEACGSGISVGETPMRRLSREEYDRTVADLLGDTSRPSLGFLPDDGAAVVAQVSVERLEGFLLAAESLAEETYDERRDKLFTCDPAAPGCGEEFVRGFGRRAYRRDLTQEEIDGYLAILSEAESFRQGVTQVVETMLVSPNFLYHLEVVGDGTPGVYPLEGYALASRLSYFLWGTMPDDALLDAAAAGELATVEGFRAQVDRLLQADRAEETLIDLIEHWLELGILHDSSKSETRYPEFDDALVDSMAGSARRFLRWLINEEEGRLTTLLRSNVAFVDAPLARLLETPAPMEGFARVELDGTERAGILTHPAVLTSMAGPTHSSPVKRGMLVRERLFCDTVPEPPPDLVVELPPYNPGISNRQRWEEHLTSESCSGCHRLIDPIGFAFEAFDAIGRHRQRDEGFLVDATGKLVQTDVDGPLDGPVELARRLTESREVEECVPRLWFRLVFDRVESEDLCSVAQLQEAFDDSGHSLDALFRAMTETDAFRHRRIVSSE